MLDHLAAARRRSSPAGAGYVTRSSPPSGAAFARPRPLRHRSALTCASPPRTLLRDPALRDPRRRSPRRPRGGDTVYLCTADADGNACSLIQSLYYGFGSAFVAGDTGVLLHNRAHYFSLDERHPNRLEPGKRTLHTLMACMALEDGRPRFVFGTMGADGQPQTNVQVLHRLLDRRPPRGTPWPRRGSCTAASCSRTTRTSCRWRPTSTRTRWRRCCGRRSRALKVLPARDERMGHAHAIAIGPRRRLTAGADPRSDGSAETL